MPYIGISDLFWPTLYYVHSSCSRSIYAEHPKHLFRQSFPLNHLVKHSAAWSVQW